MKEIKKEKVIYIKAFENLLFFLNVFILLLFDDEKLKKKKEELLSTNWKKNNLKHIRQWYVSYTSVNLQLNDNFLLTSFTF